MAPQKPDPTFDRRARRATTERRGWREVPVQWRDLLVLRGPKDPLPVGAFGFLIKRRSLAGSAIGGIRETQEMLDFCAAHNIAADVEVINIKDINEAYLRMEKADVKYRFVIDMSTI